MKKSNLTIDYCSKYKNFKIKCRYDEARVVAEVKEHFFIS